MAQINWTKLKGELNKFADLEQLKNEAQRLTKEIAKFDIQAHLSPSAKEKLKKVETRYLELSKTLSKTQRQVDREVNRMLRQVKDQRARAEQGLELLKSIAKVQSKKLDKARDLIKAQVAKATGTKKPARKTRKKSAKTAN